MKQVRPWAAILAMMMALGCTLSQLAALQQAIGIPPTPPRKDPSATGVGTITTVAGTGEAGYTGDGGPAAAAQIGGPGGMAIDSLDQLYFIDSFDRWYRIRKIDSRGNISSISDADYLNDYPNDGSIPYHPFNLGIDPLGNLFVVCKSENLILMQELTGAWKVVAGGENNTVYRGPRQGGVSDSLFPETPPPDPPPGQEGVAIGDGKPAAEAALNAPWDIAFDRSGNMYISDLDYERIRRVDRQGIMSTYAGSGPLNPFNPGPQPWYGGDGGPATSAYLNDPRGIAFDQKGNLYVADALNHRVRKIDTQGIITTVAGNGEAGFAGDGGPAISARLKDPWDVAVDNFGNLYIADASNHRIRRVDSEGVITTIAGTGTPNRDRDGHLTGDNGASDGGPALSARLADPMFIAVDSQGSVYLAESHSNRIRKISFQ